MAAYQAVIGLEIHVQLKTASKMFCRCNNNAEGTAPNHHTCPVCLGMPGTLPVPNRQAVLWALQTARALGCEIAAESKFDRKQYFYPDLPKGYQISQYDQPLGGPGRFEFDLVGPDNTTTPFSVGITRLHLEEDAGKLTHPPGATYSLVDLNRAGTPLMEIVTDPIVLEDLEQAPTVAKLFLQELRLLMRHLGVSDAEMEKGHLRADANISVNQRGSSRWGAKVEIKNMNSFKFVERGIRSEIARQQAAYDAGEEVVQETRGFVEATGETLSQRSKEGADDYRYFPEPDIPPLESRPLVAELAATMPPGPVALRRSWRKAGLTNEHTIANLVQQPAVAAAFAAALPDALGDRNRFGVLWSDLVAANPDPACLPAITEFSLALQREREAGTINPSKAAYLKQFTALQGGLSLSEALGGLSFSAAGLEEAIREALRENSRAVADVRSGNPNAVNVLVGAVMKRTKGAANPAEVKAAVLAALQD